MKFVHIAILNLLKRMNGVDRENGAHKSLEWQILEFETFWRYLKICDEQTVEIWTPIRFWVFKGIQWFLARLRGTWNSKKTIGLSIFSLTTVATTH